MQPYKYSKIKVVDAAIFASELHLKPMYMMPCDDVDIYADQLHQLMTDVLDELTPLKTCTRQCGKHRHCWLPDAAVQAKKERR